VSLDDVAVSVTGISKRYRIGGLQAANRTLRETITDAVLGPVRGAIDLARRGRPKTGADDVIWALKDVSFDVKRGEVLGIIGRNGAGKSTILKILTRITAPTQGRAEIRGRVGSLLEVGTGFHAELTGRENIYLNGAILGMKRREINRKFDEIVEFSEVQKFIDTPVKHYSSGMYLRLAFAVAASLQTEILLVDEVLAVGDVSFQNKCMGKMEDVAGAGRTVVFVSHNLSAIKALCSRCICLQHGEVFRDGPSSSVVDEYIAMGGTSGSVFALPDHDQSDTGQALRILNVDLLRSLQGPQGRTTLELVVRCQAQENIAFNFEWRVVSLTGVPILFGAPEIFRHAKLKGPIGQFDVAVTIQSMPLAAATYRLELAATQAFRRVLDRVHIPFSVGSCDPWGSGFDFRLGSNWAPQFGTDDIRIRR